MGPLFKMKISCGKSISYEELTALADKNKDALHNTLKCGLSIEGVFSDSLEKSTRKTPSR
jgi:hypothetical protein